MLLAPRRNSPSNRIFFVWETLAKTATMDGMLLNYLLLGLVILTLGVLLYLIALQCIFLWPTLFGAVFVPSKEAQIRTMLALAKATPGERIVDLGSGDGTVLFAVAQEGLDVEGLEMNPILVKRSLRKANALGLQERISVQRKNFFHIDFSEYDVILLYGITYIMNKLERKLRKELKPGARVISNHFQFPNWQPEREENDVRMYRMNPPAS
ncbi:methyltransferase domain-containing protein [Candidatus Uhrbacteria bacterium]|nr:methyltransferase domain-containing protein [Candidatus Uhrbacteria bacterium]MBD3284160.1 methyltransferase domain-containing protein [Candidatus Uhrbacteria bacterium]